MWEDRRGWVVQHSTDSIALRPEWCADIERRFSPLGFSRNTWCTDYGVLRSPCSAPSFTHTIMVCQLAKSIQQKENIYVLFVFGSNPLVFVAYRCISSIVEYCFMRMHATIPHPLAPLLTTSISYLSTLSQQR